MKRAPRQAARSRADRDRLLESSCVSVATMERNMEVTAYCNCGKCCCWEHGLLVSPTHYLALSQTRTLFPIPSLRLKRRRKNPYQDEKEQKTYIFDKYWTATTLRGCVYEGESKQKNQNARIPIPLPLSLSVCVYLTSTALLLTSSYAGVAEKIRIGKTALGDLPKQARPGPLNARSLR